jgi:hypothetical protein
MKLSLDRSLLTPRSVLSDVTGYCSVKNSFTRLLFPKAIISAAVVMKGPLRRTYPPFNAPQQQAESGLGKDPAATGTCRKQVGPC